MATKIIELPLLDWQKYKKLRLRALIEDPLAFGSSYQEVSTQDDNYWINNLQQAQAGDDKWMVFAEKEDELVGMITANLHHRGKVQIHAVFVVPEFRRMKIASQLMEKILELIGKSSQAKKIYLDVNKEQTAAIRLYEKFGFKIIDEALEPLSDNNYHPVFVMSRPVFNSPPQSPR